MHFLRHPVCNLKVTEGQVNLSALLGTLRVCINSSFSDILMVLKIHILVAVKSYTIDFSLFSGNQISRYQYITFSVLNCKLAENIIHIFCLGQTFAFYDSDHP